MITETMVKPSHWIDQGIKIQPVKNIYLFKFDEDLQNRLDDLNQKKKAEELSPEETAELAGILELDQIFTLLNAKMIETLQKATAIKEAQEVINIEQVINLSSEDADKIFSLIENSPNPNDYLKTAIQRNRDFFSETDTH